VTKLTKLTQPLPGAITEINLRLLQTFMLVGNTLSFREAAEQTHRSQSAVSTQIKQLEAQLGIALLHRTTRSVELTEEGVELLAGTRLAMHEVHQRLRKIRESADIRRGRVSLACSPSVAATQMPHILSAFQTMHPQVSIALLELHSDEIFKAVREGNADFGIGPRVATAGDDIRFEAIHEDRIVALVPRALLPNFRKTISLAELSAMPLVMHAGGTAMRQMIEEAASARGLIIKSAYQCMQMQTLVSMAAAGLGAAILPASVIVDGPPAGTQLLRLVEPALSRDICVSTVRGRPLSPTAEQLLALVRERVGRAAAL